MNLKIALIIIIPFILCCTSNNNESNNHSITDSTKNQAITLLSANKDSLLRNLFEKAYLSDSDSIAKAQFKENFMILLQDSNSIHDAYPLLIEKGIKRIESDDKKLRIFSWDDNSGGTMRFFISIFQYKDSEKTSLHWYETENLEKDEYVPLYTDVHQISMDNNTIYLLSYIYINSSKDVTEGIKAVSYVNNEITPVKIFKSENEEPKDYIETHYDVTEVSDDKSMFLLDDLGNIKQDVFDENFKKKTQHFKWMKNRYEQQ